MAEQLMLRKYAQDYLRSIGVKRAEDFQPHEQSWTNLAKARRNARAEINKLVDATTDGVDEKRAAEHEQAADALIEIIDNISEEMDYRDELGDREPRQSAERNEMTPADISKRPTFEERTAPCGDFGDAEIEPDKDFALRSDQSLTSWAKPMTQTSYDGLSLGKYFRSMVMGATNDTERRALSEGTDSAGGYTVPTVLSSALIDRLRAESVVVRAGARTIPLTSDNQSIAKLATDPTPAFRAEAGAISESDPTFTNVTLIPRSMAVMTKISRELFEDSLNLESELPRILTVAMAKEMDRIALLGSGTAPEPRGIANQSGIGTTAKDAAITSYADLLAAQTDILTNNAGPVSAIIMHPRDAGDCAGLTDTTNQPLIMPSALSGIPMLTTTAIPVDGGSGSNESTIFMGNFNHLLIGVRSAIRVDVLRERFADNHQYGLVAHMRFDVAVEHAQAFHTITGVQS